MSIKKLTVSYRNHIVGLLAEVSPGHFAFQYDETWLKNGFSIAPLSLPLTPKIYDGSIKHFEGLFGVFYDSLPDGWGEIIMQRKLRSIGLNYATLSPLVKLSLVGKNGLGGLTYQPHQAEPHHPSDVDLDSLARDAAIIVKDESGELNLDKMVALGGSSGGARPKVHITVDDRPWIIKFPHPLDPKDIGKKEYQLNLLAKKSGIRIPDIKLFPSKTGSGYFGSVRFDRDQEQGTHVISLSALLETSHRIPNLDYAHAFEVMQMIGVDQEDQYELFRRMYFNIKIQNKDDHGKNMSLTYDHPKQGYILSPAYDLTSTPSKFEHEMAVLGNGNPTKKDALALAKKFKLKTNKIEAIIDQIDTVIPKG